MRRVPVFLVVSLALAIAAPAVASTGAGTEGPSFGPSVVSKGLEATGQKPESKLFYTPDGRWWAVLGLEGEESGVYLLELTGGGWVPTLRLAESDPWAKADTLYDAGSSTLYVSLRDNKPPTETNPRRSTLHRLTFSEGGWSEPAPPITITTAAPETITIARDTAGRIWVAFEKNKLIKAGYLPVGGSAFKYLTVSETNVTVDDIAAVIAFGEPGAGKIGVLWSDQLADRFVFAARSDASRPRITSFTRTVVYGDGVGGCPTAGGDLCADDHVNLTAVGGDVLAAVKTSLNDVDAPIDGDPLIVLLRRSAAGSWTAVEVSDVAANFSRPIVVADPTGDQVHVFANVLFDDTYRWTTSLSTPSFGAPQPWTVHDVLALGNPTSTKQNVSASTGVVVMTSTPKSPYRYWYDVIAPDPS